MAGQRVCTKCGATYNIVDNPTKVPGSCDACGGSLAQRDDDTEDAIRRRLEIYETTTAPLIDWYRQRGLAGQVNAVGDVDDCARPAWWPRWRGPPGQGCRSKRAPLARTRARVPWGHEAPARRDSQDAQGGPGGSGDAGSHFRRRQAGGDDGALDELAREVLERRGAAFQLPRLSRFSRGDLHVPQQCHRPRDTGRYVVQEGDIISLDCGAIIEGYHGDAAVTVAVGEVHPRSTSSYG